MKLELEVVVAVVVAVALALVEFMVVVVVVAVVVFTLLDPVSHPQALREGGVAGTEEGLAPGGAAPAPLQSA